MLDPTSATLARKWGFEPEIELPPGYCSRVYASADRVLKVPFQGEELESGFRAALALSGTIGPRVFESDPSTGAFLMERIVPGTKLHESGLNEDECRRMVLGFAAQIAKLDPAGLMPVSQYVSRRDPLALRLLETTMETVFLHGDLHHENILLGPKGWVVIDPKGLLGDPAFEPSAYIRNHAERIEGTTLANVLQGRIETIAEETGLDPWRVAAWALVAPGSGVETEPWRRVKAELQRLVRELER